jgi:hypothetical protein
MKNYYYISTGDLNGFYTLKHRFDEIVYVRSEGYESTGAVEATLVERDHFIKNLSTDKDQALVSATAWLDEHGVEPLRRRLGIDWDLDEIQRRKAADLQAERDREAERIRTTDWNILPFGKHAGEDLRNLINTDPGYVKFVAGWDSGDGKHCAAIAKQLLAPIIAEEEQEREVKKSRLIDIFGLDRLRSYADYPFGGFAASIANSILAGQEVRERGLSIFVEIVAKEKGRANSKAFKSEYSRLCDLVFCEA